MEEEKNKKKKLSLSVGKKLTIGGLIDQKTLRSGSVNTSRNKTIQVEVRRKKFWETLSGKTHIKII